jgi:hypothetical protein
MAWHHVLSRLAALPWVGRANVIPRDLVILQLSVLIFRDHHVAVARHLFGAGNGERD